MPHMTGSNQPLPGDQAFWSAIGYPITIEYPITLLEEIRADAVNGLHLLRHGGIEVGGVLFGSHEGDRIRISKSRALVIEYAQGPSFLLSENDQAALEKLIEDSATDKELIGLEPVGWYHSHTRTGVSLSEQDLAIHNRHFPRPWQIVLILRPTQLGPAEAGFFFREPDGTMRRESSYNSFVISPPPREDETVTGSEEVTSDPLSFEAWQDPSTLSSNEPPSQKWMWLIAGVIVALLGMGVWLGVFHISGVPANRPTLNLRAADQNGQIRIEWDRAAAPIRTANHASVLIVDGDNKLETALSPELLHNGNLSYRRKTPDVEIRLRVYGADTDPVQELTRLIGLPPAPMESYQVSDRTSEKPRPRKDPKVQWVQTGKRAPAVRAATPKSNSSLERRPRLSPQVATTQANAPPRASLNTRASLNSTTVPEAPHAIVTEPKQQDPPVYHGPSTGRLIWTGTLPAKAGVQIDGKRASAGDLKGELPGTPVKINAYPATFSHGAIVVAARDLPGGKAIAEMPGPNNGWTKTVYRQNSKHARDITVVEPPSERNHWRTIGLRADRNVSVVVIDWEVVPANP